VKPTFKHPEISTKTGISRCRLAGSSYPATTHSYSVEIVANQRACLPAAGHGSPLDPSTEARETAQVHQPQPG